MLAHLVGATKEDEESVTHTWNAVPATAQSREAYCSAHELANERLSLIIHTAYPVDVVGDEFAKRLTMECVANGREAATIKRATNFKSRS